MPVSFMWMRFLQHFHLVLFDHPYLRFAMMAQAVIPCDLALRCKVEAIEVLYFLLLFFESHGSYGHVQACP